MASNRQSRTVRGPREPVSVIGSRLERPQGPGGHVPYAALLGLLTFLLVATLSVWQLTSGAVARQLLAEGIAALTDSDSVLAQARPAMVDAATADPSAPVVVPGFPLDVSFTAQEARSAPARELRDLLLGRSAAIVYSDGLAAFDRTGDASLGFFSREGLLDSFVGQLSESNHSRSSVVLLVLAALTAFVVAMVTARTRGHRQLRTIGVPLFLAGISGYALCATIIPFVLGHWWSGDPFSETIDGLISDAIGIPRRNFLVLTVLGLAFTLAGLAIEAIARRFAPSDPGSPLPATTRRFR
ncbi:MAG: hypothetical protein KC495_11945 [Dehalococcoidia bacterium]|nr:hypothetical protein [Dehalococcoidia bacterium]